MQADKIHTVTELSYHFIWHTKNKIEVSDEKFRKRLQEILRQTCEQRKIILLGGRIGKNFVHMIVTCPANLSVSSIANQLKGRSSRMLQQEFTDMLRNKSFGESLWGRGYFCKSFGVVESSEVELYISGLTKTIFNNG